jgi:hypothetical protein
MIKLIVTAICYTRYLDPWKDVVRVYEGDDLLTLYKEIAENHGYSPYEEHTEPFQVLAKIEQENGDGCDCILSIIDGEGNIVFDGTTD